MTPNYSVLHARRGDVASIFNAFGSRVELFETGPRILAAEDAEVAAAVAKAFREAGIIVHENVGAIDSFEKTSAGVRMNFSKNGKRDSAEAALAVVAASWVANTSGLNLAAAGVLCDHRGFVKVDDYLRTSASNIFAAGDVTGRLMLVPPAIQEILGCHVVGGRAVEIAQVAAIAISAGMRMDDLARVPLAFPTYTGNLAYAAAAPPVNSTWT